MSESVDHPSHYGGEDDPYEVIKVLRAWDLTLAKGFCWGNLIKYTARAGKKGSTVEDRRKAEWYATELVSIEAELAGGAATEQVPLPSWVQHQAEAENAWPDYDNPLTTKNESGRPYDWETVLGFQPPGTLYVDDLGFKHILAPDNSWWTRSRINGKWYWGEMHVPFTIQAKARMA